MSGIESTVTLLRDLARKTYWGSLEVKLEAGNVVLLRKMENLKPDNLRDNRGGGYDER